MPTAARLTAAIAFAILGYLIYITMVPSFGDKVVPSYLLPLCLAAGLWTGWVLCGAKAHGIRSGVGTGLTAVVAMAFSIVFIMSFVQMIYLSMRRRYDGPMDAIMDVFNLMFENLAQFASPTMGLIVFVGGIVAGIAAGMMCKWYPR